MGREWVERTHGERKMWFFFLILLDIGRIGVPFEPLQMEDVKR